jgi:hypothetical protein
MKDIRKKIVYLAIVIFMAAVVVATFRNLSVSVASIEEIKKLYRDDADYSKLTVSYPLDETVFPPELIPPTFQWEDAEPETDAWVITIGFQNGQDGMDFMVSQTKWTPAAEDWAIIKRRSLEKQALVTILGVNRLKHRNILSAGKMSIKTSEDPVGAPLFYR